MSAPPRFIDPFAPVPPDAPAFRRLNDAQVTPPRSLESSPLDTSRNRSVLPTDLPIPLPTSTPATPSGTRRLPTTSPPSARLRKLAPTPVKIPPTPPFPYTSRAQANTLRHWAASTAKAGAGAGAGASAPAGYSPFGRKGSTASSISNGEAGTEDDHDPFDLEFQFAALPTGSSAHYAMQQSQAQAHELGRRVREATGDTVRVPKHAEIGSRGSGLVYSGAQMAGRVQEAGRGDEKEDDEEDDDMDPFAQTRSPLHLPARPPNIRQDSSTTYRTNSTMPSFSTSPVLVSAKVFPAALTAPTAALSPSPSRFTPAAAFAASHRPPAPAPAPALVARGSITDPDVPDEILDDPLPLSAQSSQWSDDDLRGPSRRTGDELLTPGAFLAAHVPRPVLVQFRDVFGANDTFAPHLPTSPPAHAQPPTPRGGYDPLSPADTPIAIGRIVLPPSANHSPMDSGASHGMSPGGVSLAESFATFGVHTGRSALHTARQREESAGSVGSGNGSFTFSAYLEDDDPVRQSLARLGQGNALRVDEGEVVLLTQERSSRPLPRSRSTAALKTKQALPLRTTSKAPFRQVHPQQRQHPPLETTQLGENLTPRTAVRGMIGPSDYTSRQTAGSTGWIHPFARSASDSPGSSDSDSGEGEDLVTPEQRDIALVDVEGASATSGFEQKQRLLHPRVEIGTPTPVPRSVAAGVGLGIGVGLGLELNGTGKERTYRPPTPPLTGLERDSADALAVAMGGRGSGEVPYRLPALGPKKYKSLASLRKHLPSSRGSSRSDLSDVAASTAAPVPPLPHSHSYSGTPVHTHLPSSASLTGKSTSSRPATAVPASTSVPIGESFLSLSPPPTSASNAFSVNAFDTASTAVPTNEKKKAEEWKGTLKADVVVDGVVISRASTINLWVDQENCREVISTLHPIRWHRPGLTRTRALCRIDDILSENKVNDYEYLDEKMDDPHDEGNVFWKEGCMEYGMNPRMRAKWEFSYGAFEAVPSLRRVTMDGRQNYDFTSRIAALKHRSRGIYAVSGEEKDGAKWRFRYMVDIPNGGDPSGRIIVPMSFYVNPSFIRGTHIQRLGLTTMLSKALRSKVQAARLPTPEFHPVNTVPSAYIPPEQVAEKPKGNHYNENDREDPEVLPDSSKGDEEAPLLPKQFRTDVVSERGTELETPRAPARPTNKLSTPRQADIDVQATPTVPMTGANVAERTVDPPPRPPKRAVRPATAQDAPRTPLTSLARPNVNLDVEDRQRLPPQPSLRQRPGTAAAAFPPLAVLDTNRVAPFLKHEPPTPVTPPRSAPILPRAAPGKSGSGTGSTFGRMRALTTITRPITPLSAPLAPVREADPPMPHSASSTSSFASGFLRAKKSLGALRSGRPATAGLPVSRPTEPPLPLSSSASLGLVADTAGGRLRTKSSHAAMSVPKPPTRPSTSGAAQGGHSGPGLRDGSTSAGLFSAFKAPFTSSTRSSSRPSTADPRTAPAPSARTSAQKPLPLTSRSKDTSRDKPLPPLTPEQRRPPAALAHAHGLAFNFGSYTATPPSGITVSALAMQQLEARQRRLNQAQGSTSPAAALRRQVFADEAATTSGPFGSATSASVSAGPVKGGTRRPRTADPRSGTGRMF